MMKIAGRQIGTGQRPFIIAEVAQGHDGSLGNALAFIDAAKASGADAIKFQTHIAEEESTVHEPWRTAFSKQDATRYEYWRRMEFTFDQWRILKNRADELGIVFMSSPFSIRACEWLQALDIPAWKLASGEAHNRELIDWVAATGKPIIVSSGLSTAEHSVALVQELSIHGNDVALLHCTSHYPTAADQVGLNVLSHYLEVLQVPVGLSDHSGVIHPGIVATYLGAAILEVHLAWHKGMFGPDTPSALTPDGLGQLVAAVDFTHRMRSAPVDKSQQLDGLAKERFVFGRSLVAAADIPAGVVLKASDLVYKKPGGGLPFEQRELLVGKRTRTALRKDQIILIMHVE